MYPPFAVAVSKVASSKRGGCLPTASWARMPFREASPQYPLAVRMLTLWELVHSIASSWPECAMHEAPESPFAAIEFLIRTETFCPVLRRTASGAPRHRSGHWRGCRYPSHPGQGTCMRKRTLRGLGTPLRYFEK